MRPLDILDDGLRVSLPDGTTQPLRRYLAPLALLLASASLLATSILLPYWSMDLEAPQYPEGLRVEVYVDHIEGDVAEIDSLNHYLGLPALEKGGQLERRIAIPAILGIAGLAALAYLVRNKWASLLALPAVMYPLVFLADLWYILYAYGHGIDPTSPLGGAIEPFTPPLFGRGQVGQFASVAHAELGFYLAALAAIVGLAGLWTHRVSYKPLHDARHAAVSSNPGRSHKRGA